MYHASECLRVGIGIYPVAAGIFHGDGSMRDRRMVPSRFVISMTERGVAEERFAWGSGSVGRGDLLLLWPDHWHDLTEGGGKPVTTCWIDLEGPGTSALPAAFGATTLAPIVRPRQPGVALRLQRAMAEDFVAPERLPPIDFARRFFALAELCSGDRWSPQEVHVETLVEQAEALWTGEQMTALGPSQLAQRLGVHPNTLLNAVRRERAMTTAHLVQTWKVARARRLLEHSDQKIAAVARTSGFASVSHFIHAVRRVTGKRPSELRRASP